MDLFGIDFISVLAVAAAATYIYFVWRPMRANPMTPYALMLTIFAYMFLVRSTILAVGLDTPVIEDPFNGPFQYLVVFALLAGCIWLTFAHIGFRLGEYLPRGLGYLVPKMQTQASIVDLTAIALTFSALSFAILFLLIHKFGGIGQVIIAVKVKKELSGGYVLRQFSVFAMITAGLAYFQNGYYKKTKLGMSLKIVPLVMPLLFLVNALAVYVWGSRNSILVAIVVMAVGYHTFVRNLSVRKLTVFGIVILVLLQAGRYGRDELISLSTGGTGALQQMSIWHQMALSLHQGQFDAFMLVLKLWLSPAKWRWGQDIANGFSGMVPGFLWPDKPYLAEIGAWFRGVYEPAANGLPMTPAGAAFLQFGWAGLITNGALTGLVFRVVERRLAPDPGREQTPYNSFVGTAFAMGVMEGGVWPDSQAQYVDWMLPFFLLAATIVLLDRTALLGRIGAPTGAMLAARNALQPSAAAE